jgi:hypothetical protein
MVFSNLIAIAIGLVPAAMIHKVAVTNVECWVLAAGALKPLEPARHPDSTRRQMARVIGRKPVRSRATSLDIAGIAFIGGIFPSVGTCDCAIDNRLPSLKRFVPPLAR